jgi:hypothetical protein
MPSRDATTSLGRVEVVHASILPASADTGGIEVRNDGV